MVRYTPEEIIKQEKFLIRELERQPASCEACKTEAIQYHWDIIYYLEFAIKHANW